MYDVHVESRDKLFAKLIRCSRNTLSFNHKKKRQINNETFLQKFMSEFENLIILFIRTTTVRYYQF